MEDQRSDFDTLPSTLILRPLIHKRAMRRPPSPPIQFGVKTLDQQHLPRRLLSQIIPAMTRIWPDRKSLADTIRVNQLHSQEVVVRHGSGIRDPEWVFADGLDGTPDVDDLIATFEEALSVGGKVVLDAFGAGFVGLINVDALDGAAEYFGGAGLALVGGLAADGVVEDEDLGGAGAGRMVLISRLGTFALG